jgi:hypothetical protein
LPVPFLRKTPLKIIMMGNNYELGKWMYKGDKPMALNTALMAVFKMKGCKNNSCRCWLL